MSSVTNVCNRCKVPKDIDDFYRKSSSSDRRNKICKECLSKSHAKYYDENSEKIRAYRRNYGRMHRYGISESDVVKMIDEQNGICAICQEEISSNSHVDHDHETGQIRAILCKNCNIALGLLKDDFGNLARALDYLLFHKEQRDDSYIMGEDE